MSGWLEAFTKKYADKGGAEQFEGDVEGFITRSKEKITLRGKQFGYILNSEMTANLYKPVKL
jgi:hypothetical protein